MKQISLQVIVNLLDYDKTQNALLAFDFLELGFVFLLRGVASSPEEGECEGRG